MKKLFFVVCYFCIAMEGCDRVDRRLANDTSKKENTFNNLKDRIVGIWAAMGEENATFVIAKDTITYPDQNASYTYALVNDSMLIRFDGYIGRYLVKIKTSDTLILTGDDQQVYYRLK